MNRRNKRITSYFILFSLILILGVVYAILQANLQINGTAKITQNTWDVHFENIQVTTGSVSVGTGDNAATIDPNNDCKVDFSVTLSLPGDFYEFTVDVKNEGTIDAMIGTLTKSLKVNNVTVETVPDYLNYTVTYDDGGEILEKHLLEKNSFVTYKVRVEFKTDIDELPNAATLSMSVEPVFIQADKNAISVLHCPNQTIPTNNSVPNVPVLDTGMIPVTIADNGTVTTVSSSDTSWYDYSNKEWANAVLVKESGVKTREQNKVAGTTINPDDILAYYVWIPRYKYAIPEAQTCGCIPNVNETDYSGCYDYSVSASDLEILIQAYIDDGASDREEALERYDDNILQGNWLEAIDYYNEEYNLNIVLLSDFVSDRTINYPRTIDIVFENGTPTKSTGTAIGTSYYTHPAFTFGTQELSGIWVGKFEMSHNTLSSSTTSNNLGCTTETCTNASGLRILPNVSSIRYNNVSNMWYATRSMEQSNNVFGISNSDSHMMKNSEWGAVAYLSHSNYGINEEIRVNNYGQTLPPYNTLTGCGASTANGASTTSCEIAYANASSYPQSTTGNISGIFDMSGGAYEYVMANYNNTTGSSGFSTLPNAKYYDNYSASVFSGDYSTNITFCTLATCGGHALNETANWYGDYPYFVLSSSPWFHRGGYSYNASPAGAFHSHNSHGGSLNYNSWRGVCVAK